MSCFTFLKVMMVLFNLAIVTMGNAYIEQQRYRKMLKNIISFCVGDGNAQRKYFNSAKQEWNDPPICSHFLLGGGALLGTGIWVAVDRSSFINVFGALSSSVLQIVNVGYVLIAIGAVLFLLGFLGCCGAQKESKCLLIMFFSIVLVIFIIEIAVAVVALVYTSIAETFLQGTVTQSLKNDFGKPNSEVTTIWNTTMHNLKCCGLSNFTDFNNSYYYNIDKTYPGICCNSSPCTYENALSSNKTGCFPQLLSEIRSHAGAVGGVAAGICALEIAAMAVAMYLYCHLDEK